MRTWRSISALILPMVMALTSTTESMEKTTLEGLNIDPTEHLDSDDSSPFNSSTSTDSDDIPSNFEDEMEDSVAPMGFLDLLVSAAHAEGWADRPLIKHVPTSNAQDPSSSGSRTCVTIKGSVRITDQPLSCSPSQERYRRKCYPKCSDITKGAFPIRRGPSLCTRERCDDRVEELWNGKCFAKCSILNPEFPIRTSASRCAKSGCSKINVLTCSTGTPLRPFCGGNNVGGDLVSCPKRKDRRSIRARYGDGMKPRKHRCPTGFVYHHKFCYPMVPCEEDAQA